MTLTKTVDSIRLDVKSYQIHNLGVRPFHAFLRNVINLWEIYTLEVACAVDLVIRAGQTKALVLGVGPYVFCIEMRGGLEFKESLTSDILTTLKTPAFRKICLDDQLFQKAFVKAFGFEMQGLEPLAGVQHSQDLCARFATKFGYDAFALMNRLEETNVKTNSRYGIDPRLQAIVAFKCYMIYSCAAKTTIEPQLPIVDSKTSIAKSSSKNAKKKGKTNASPDETSCGQITNTAVKTTGKQSKNKSLASQVNEIIGKAQEKHGEATKFSFGISGQTKKKIFMFLGFEKESVMIEANLNTSKHDNIPPILIKILEDETIVKFCINLRTTVLIMYSSFGIRMAGVQSTSSIEHVQTLAALYGNTYKLNVDDLMKVAKEAESFDFNKNYHQIWSKNSVFATIAHMTYMCGLEAGKTSTEISLKHHPVWVLDMLAETWLSTIQVDQLQAKTFSAEFSAVEMNKNKLVIHQKRYKTRIRDMHKLEIVGNSGKIHAGWSEKKDIRVEGKKVIVAGVDHHNIGKVHQIKVDARDDISSEMNRLKKITDDVLKGILNIENNSFLRTLFGDTSKSTEDSLIAAMKNLKLNEAIPSGILATLNPSQKKAVNAIVALNDNTKNLVLLHGPPGTGKTTVISSAVNAWIQTSEAKKKYSFLCCARSNVAVLNIVNALEKASVTDFAILVSTEYHFDWHEDQYRHLSEQLVQTSQLHSSRQAMKAKVILCTIGSLMSETVSNFLKQKKIRRMVIDEASQVPLSSYIFPFITFSTLISVSFFGDPQQVELRDVFSIKSLLSNGIFLDTCYRLPGELATFISNNVYNSRLQAFKSDSSRPPVHWINIQGKEEVSKSKIKNRDEAKAIVRHISDNLRYTTKKVVIITPYDAQRQVLTDMLLAYKIEDAEKLVYTIDSYQGHEADIVYVSLVRTRAPGFLVNKRRCNVMLTRCREAMMIFGHYNFVMKHQALQGSLVREIALFCQQMQSVTSDASKIIVRKK